MILTSPLGVHRKSARVPLVLEDGLFALQLETLVEGDPRFGSLPKYTIALPGRFAPSDSAGDMRWQPTILAMASSSARLLAALTEDCHDHLRTFCDQYLAPPSIPPARRLYDVQSQEDMAQLSIHFLGASTDRLVRTVAISNGLKSPASKKALRVPPLIFPQGRLKRGKCPKSQRVKWDISNTQESRRCFSLISLNRAIPGAGTAKFSMTTCHVSVMWWLCARRQRSVMLLQNFAASVGFHLFLFVITRGRMWAAR